MRAGRLRVPPVILGVQIDARATKGTRIAVSTASTAFVLPFMPRSHLSSDHLWTTRSFEFVEPPILALIVDDDEALAEALAQALIAGGLQPTAVLGGAAALCL